MKKLYIGGLTGAGKGLLRILLDGHPNILNCNFQGLGMSLLSPEFKKYIRRDKIIVAQIRDRGKGGKNVNIKLEGRELEVSVGDIIVFLLREDNGIVNLFKDSIHGLIKDGTENNDCFVDFEFDFSYFLRNLTTELLQTENFDSLENLQDHLYETFINTWKNPFSYDSQNFYFTNTIKTGKVYIQRALEENVSSKVIVVQRDPVGLIYTNARKICNITDQRISKSTPEGKKFYKIIYAHPMIENIKDFNTAVKKMSQKHSNLYCVQFEDYVFDPKRTMANIAEFLEIEMSDLLCFPSLNGNCMDENTGQYIGNVRDDPAKAINKSDLELLKHLTGMEQHSNGISGLGFAINKMRHVIRTFLYKKIYWFNRVWYALSR